MTDTAARAPQPFIVGIGGTSRPNSSTEKAIRFALRKAEALGAETVLLGADDLKLPIYEPDGVERTPAALHLVDVLRRADGLILGSPGYHCGISGLVKNAIDYAQDLAQDQWPYLSGRAVGLVATGAGWQGAVATLGALRTVVHALRGWPTALGVPINTLEALFDSEGNCTAPKVGDQLEGMASQVMDFALSRTSRFAPFAG